jgi:signal peptidase I
VRPVPAATVRQPSHGGGGLHARPPRRRIPAWLELPLLVVVAFALALLIKAFLVQAFYIPSGSMERTLLLNDRVLVNKVIYHFREPHRGEIVVFDARGTNFPQEVTDLGPPSGIGRVLRPIQDLLGLGAPSSTHIIKRVIGVPGDTVACCDAQGRVTVNGQGLDEPYVYENTPRESRSFGPVQVPTGRLWVMGDHRGNSSDSRVNGTIPISNVTGRAFVRIWPLSRIGWLRVPGSTFAHIPAPTAAVAGGVLALPLAQRRRRRSGAKSASRAA